MRPERSCLAEGTVEGVKKTLRGGEEGRGRGERNWKSEKLRNYELSLPSLTRSPRLENLVGKNYKARGKKGGMKKREDLGRDGPKKGLGWQDISVWPGSQWRGEKARGNPNEETQKHSPGRRASPRGGLTPTPQECVGVIFGGAK